MSKSDATRVLLDYLSKENSPCGLNEVVEKFGKEHGKSNVQRLLDGLVEKGKVTAKSCGKHKIYFIRQSTELSEHKKELLILRQKLAQSQQNVKSKQVECRELEAKLKSMPKIRSVESLEQERGQLMDGIRELNEKLRHYDTKMAEAKLTPADAKRIEKSYERVSVAYRKRKRICTDMLDAILEGYPKTKRALIEDIGVETDESAGFNVEIKR